MPYYVFLENLRCQLIATYGLHYDKRSPDGLSHANTKGMMNN